MNTDSGQQCLYTTNPNKQLVRTDDKELINVHPDGETLELLTSSTPPPPL